MRFGQLWVVMRSLPHTLMLASGVQTCQIFPPLIQHITSSLPAMGQPSAWTGNARPEIYDCVIDFGGEGVDYGAAHNEK